MSDETIYKRDQKAKKISKKVQPSSKKLRFKDRDINITRMISIGRDKSNDIVIKDDPLVSRKHALIEKEGKKYFILDKGSTNGTYLNNNPIPRAQKVEVKSGDIVVVGKTKLKIV